MSNVYAVVENGTVTNVIVWDGDQETWAPPEGCTVQLLAEGETAGPGWTWDGEAFTSPSPPSSNEIPQ